MLACADNVAIDRGEDPKISSQANKRFTSTPLPLTTEHSKESLLSILCASWQSVVSRLNKKETTAFTIILTLVSKALTSNILSLSSIEVL